MFPHSVKPPTIPIPFHKLLKVVAIVDKENAQTRQLLDQIAAENFEVEVTDSFERDVSEDSSVGAYIALIDGDRREKARKERRGDMPILTRAELDRVLEPSTSTKGR